APVTIVEVAPVSRISDLDHAGHLAAQRQLGIHHALDARAVDHVFEAGSDDEGAGLRVIGVPAVFFFPQRAEYRLRREVDAVLRHDLVGDAAGRNLAGYAVA